jgi:hypothetical protein
MQTRQFANIKRLAEHDWARVSATEREGRTPVRTPRVS